ncbi:MAG: SLBB domain-containing protein, partial [Bacteroidota bacterium]
DAPGPGADSSIISSLPEDLSERIYQLRASGVPERVIEAYLIRAINQQNRTGGNINSSLSIPTMEDPLSPGADANLNFSYDSTQYQSDTPKKEADLIIERFKAQQFIKDELEKIRQINLTKYQDSLQKRSRDSLQTFRSSIFGQHIFDTRYRFFTQNSSVIPSDRYVLGEGDNLIIAVWGSSELYESLTLDAEGAVFRQYLGKLRLGGLTLAQAKKVLTDRYRRIVAAGSRIEISLGINKDQKEIAVNVVGYVKKPGLHTVSLNATALEALFEAAGVSENGSVRAIKVIRNDKVVAELDLYAYLLEGKPIPNITNNDFVVVPSQGKVVRLTGDIRRPMFYELKDQETLEDLFGFAGGMNYDSRANDVRLRRVTGDKIKLSSFNLEEQDPSSIVLQANDDVYVEAKRKEIYNYVEANGFLRYPGSYQLLPGERVSDLIRKAGGLDTTAFLGRAYITRILSPGELSHIPINLQGVLDGDPSQNIPLQFFDQLLVFSQSDYRYTKYITIQGLVRRPGEFLLVDKMSLKDLIYMAGGFEENADLTNIELSNFLDPEELDVRERLDSEEAESNQVEQDSIENILFTYVSAGENWREDPTLDNILLDEYTNVKVYSKFDFIYPQSMRIEGAVARPGNYRIDRTTTLKNMIYRAGGLTPAADVREIELHRRIEIEDKGKYGTLSPVPEILRIRIFEDWQNDQTVDTFKVFNYKKITVRSETEFFEQGFVDIKGRVRKPGTYPIVPNLTMKDLLYQAGGILLGADFKNIELSRVINVEDSTGNITSKPITISPLVFDQDWQNDPVLDTMLIFPYDQIFVREDPDFKLQQSVFITGEVNIPDEYNMISESEKLTSFVQRAGGLTPIAYPKGASISRPDIGSISINLAKALAKPNSKYNISLLPGDELMVPPKVNTVQIDGNVLKPGTMVLYEPGKKSFKYYVNLAGGFDRRTKKKFSTVTYVDGKTKRVKNIVFGIKSYPKIEQGTVIEIAAKPEKTASGFFRGLPRLNIQDILASATAVLTFYLLIDTTFTN